MSASMLPGLFALTPAGPGSFGPSQGRTVQCDRCAAHLPLQGLPRAVQCPYCGHVQSLDTRTVHEVRDHHREVRAQLDRADQANLEAAQLRRHYGRDPEAARVGVIYYFATMLIPAGLVGLVFLARSLGWFADSPYFFAAVAMAGALGFYGSIAGYRLWLWRKGRQGVDAASAGQAEMACPKCGAPNAFAADEAVPRCHHCHTELLPSRTIMQQSQDAARMVRRRAVLERHREERMVQAGMRVAAPGSGDRAVWVYWLGMLFAFGIAIPTVKMLSGSTPVNPLVLAAWALPAAVVGGVAWRRWSRRQLAEAWRGGLARVAHAYGGYPLAEPPGSAREGAQRVSMAATFAAPHGGRTTVYDPLAWLNAYWAGPYEAEYLAWSPLSCAAEVIRTGYPTLIDLEVTPGKDHWQPRFHVLLAAEIGVYPPNRDPSEALQALAQMGFEVEIHETGLLCRAGARMVKRLRTRPESAHILSEVIDRLTLVARCLSAEPVAPIYG